MRTRFLLTLILIALIGGTACNRSSKPAKQSIFMKRATGFAYEVLVVMDKDAWKGEAGRLLYDQLTAPIPGLPQNEPAMRVTYAEPFQFNGLLHYVRNIIHVRIDEWKNKAHHWLLGWERKNGNGRPIIWKVRIASG